MNLITSFPLEIGCIPGQYIQIDVVIDKVDVPYLAKFWRTIDKLSDHIVSNIQSIIFVCLSVRMTLSLHLIDAVLLTFLYLKDLLSSSFNSIFYFYLTNCLKYFSD